MGMKRYEEFYYKKFTLAKPELNLKGVWNVSFPLCTRILSKRSFCLVERDFCPLAGLLLASLYSFTLLKDEVSLQFSGWGVILIIKLQAF